MYIFMYLYAYLYLFLCILLKLFWLFARCSFNNFIQVLFVVDSKTNKNHWKTNKTQVKVLAWYDNEINYVSRMRDIVDLIARG